MPNACVKLVESVGKQRGKISGFLSTLTRTPRSIHQTVWVKARVFTTSFPNFPQVLSPSKIAILPLIEHTFYPVSTTPTTNTTKGN